MVEAFNYSLYVCMLNCLGIIVLLDGFCFIIVRDIDEVIRQSQEGGNQSVVAGCSTWSDERVVLEHTKKKGKSREFKKPEVKGQIDNCSMKKFAPQSQRKMKWAVNFYDGWCKNRILTSCADPEIIRCDLNCLGQFNKADLCFSLCQFVRVIKKLNGDDCPPNTIRELVIMIQMFMHERGLYWKLFDNEEFMNLPNVVDNTMKERYAMGLGVRESAEVISLQSKISMFNKGIFTLQEVQ